MEQRPHVLFMEAILPCCDLEEAHHIGMADLHALRFAGRARGVDHIGQVLRLCLLDRVRDLLAGESGSICVHTHDLSLVFRQALHQRLLGQQYCDTSIGQQKGQAFPGIRRIKGDIGASRFEDT